MKVPSVLTIAGSDSGGGAGIQADLKTFTCHGVHGCSVITCITAQNTCTVSDVMGIPPSLVQSQLETVCEDIDIQALKTGMLLNRDIMETVADFLPSLSLNHIIIDPVMVSRRGAILIAEDAITTMKERLIPLALLVTPNVYEAQILSGMKICNREDMIKAGEKIHQLGAKNVLIKGGANLGDDKGIDVFFDGNQHQWLQTKVVPTKNNHGTGCTLGAAITANLALGKSLFSAITQGKEYVTHALDYALDIGAGNGAIAHFYSLINSRVQGL